jgi:hypothetical protein
MNTSKFPRILSGLIFILTMVSCIELHAQTEEGETATEKLLALSIIGTLDAEAARLLIDERECR